ncbi:hypothetical protein AEGHOMDF_3646 [Methylobacterium soli]|nr:hypothetical protein AEGHOMDF_3646 [Methylobacterium soli]
MDHVAGGRGHAETKLLREGIDRPDGPVRQPGDQPPREQSRGIEISGDAGEIGAPIGLEGGQAFPVLRVGVDQIELRPARHRVREQRQGVGIQRFSGNEEAERIGLGGKFPSKRGVLPCCVADPAILRDPGLGLPVLPPDVGRPVRMGLRAQTLDRSGKPPPLPRSHRDEHADLRPGGMTGCRRAIVPPGRPGRKAGARRDRAGAAQDVAKPALVAAHPLVQSRDRPQGAPDQAIAEQARMAAQANAFERETRTGGDGQPDLGDVGGQQPEPVRAGQRHARQNEILHRAVCPDQAEHRPCRQGRRIGAVAENDPAVAGIARDDETPVEDRIVGGDEVEIGLPAEPRTGGTRSDQVVTLAPLCGRFTAWLHRHRTRPPPAAPCGARAASPSPSHRQVRPRSRNRAPWRPGPRGLPR